MIKFLQNKLFLTSFLLGAFLLPAFGFAADTVNIYFFESESCPHCAKEKVFLEKLEKEMAGKVEVFDFEISKNPENIKLLKKIGEEFSLDVSRIPFTMIGSSYLTGYENDETTGKVIRDLVNQCLIDEDCEDLAGSVIGQKEPQPANGGVTQKIPEKITLPFFGEIEIKNISLPLLTIVVGGIDGFNPCAMWVLIFLISLLLGMKDKKRMWILGITFIVTSAFVYFLFLAAWLNLFLFLGFVFWVRVVIGLVAVGSGVYYLKKYFTDKADVCVVSESERQQKIFDKLKNISQQKQFWLAFGGIILLAAAVNLVELICSAGLPAVYTNVLSLSGLAPWQYYSYLLLYILVFMLDDIIVFTVAMVTLKTLAFTKKYSRMSAFVGGIIITIIGILLLFKPEWLMF